MMLNKFCPSSSPSIDIHISFMKIHNSNLDFQNWFMRQDIWDHPKVSIETQDLIMKFHYQYLDLYN